MVIVTEALALADTLPAASLAQAYSVLAPALAKVYETGTVADHPLAVADGVVADSLMKYPVTATLSVAVKVAMGTVSVVAVAGMVKAVMVGGVASDSVIVTAAVMLADTLPAASLAQA
jgi:hypothetical protein